MIENNSSQNLKNTIDQAQPELTNELLPSLLVEAPNKIKTGYDDREQQPSLSLHEIKGIDISMSEIKENSNRSVRMGSQEDSEKSCVNRDGCDASFDSESDLSLDFVQQQLADLFGGDELDSDNDNIPKVE